MNFVYFTLSSFADSEIINKNIVTKNLMRAPYYMPSAIIASATFLNPAIFAPST